MRLFDLVIAGGIVGLAAWAVAAQVGSDPVGDAVAERPVRRLDPGDALEDQDVTIISGAPLKLHLLLGKRATVFYAWSTKCPCVAIVNHRLLPVIQRWKAEGVSFVAVAGDPEDTQEKVGVQAALWWDHKHSMPPPYGFVLDPTQRLCRQLGFREASWFVILDGNGVLRYRGTFDDDLKQPTQTYVPEALEAVLAGRKPEHALRPAVGYGCAFGLPAKPCPVEETPQAPPPER